MKKSLLFGTVVVLFLISCISCLDRKVKGNGDVTVEQREVSSFDKINIDGVFKVYLSQGDTEEVEVEIDENLQSYVNVYNKGSSLFLDIEKGVNWGKTTRNNVYISLKNIEQLNIKGVCSVATQTFLSQDDLKLVLDGVSNSSFTLISNNLDVKFNGVGNIELIGEVNTFNVVQNGVGSLNASDLNAAVVNIKNSGVGNAYIYAYEELYMKNSGVGSIYYSGDAVIKSVESSGVGKIHKK